MFAQPFRKESADYFGMTGRPVNYSQNLWKVNDTELHKPGERFMADNSPYLDSIVEQSIAGPLESAPIPKGLVGFVEDAIRTFGVSPTKHSSAKEVLYRVMRWLDFTEFYFLLFDSAVQQNCNQLKFTYRLKEGGSVLSPESLECFNIRSSYDFPHYKGFCELMSHPSVRTVLQGGAVYNPAKSRPVDRIDILEKISKIIYGDFEGLQADVEQWIFDHYSSSSVLAGLTDEELLSLDSDRQFDTTYWMVATLAALVWFKSPYAIRFLSEYHPVYMKLLRWDAKQSRMVVIPESGGEVVVDGWNIYTRENLVVEQANPPGTCESCKQPLHCTKYINAQALFHPQCSCGSLVSVEDANFQGHGWNEGCSAYLRQYPPFSAFVCQRCMYMAINRMPKETTKCQRTSCPATSCPHHIGARAYAYELTKRRTMLLPGRTYEGHPSSQFR